MGACRMAGSEWDMQGMRAVQKSVRKRPGRSRVVVVVKKVNQRRSWWVRVGKKGGGGVMAGSWVLEVQKGSELVVPRWEG
jgi:hypothetical protein